ncbi:hypothetical protein E2C01_080962 [Portunus trituberculatus]|uniref:Uncharacterized protein n=1 Tax=Portunus trituberculatus TaxID=210409 RepID=A0A5B7IWR9_PORTR|nr:hypothetical protein [Portunus trituberculatus]
MTRGRPVCGEGNASCWLDPGRWLWLVAGSHRGGPGSSGGMLVLGKTRRGWDESTSLTTFVITNKYIKICDASIPDTDIVQK